MTHHVITRFVAELIYIAALDQLRDRLVAHPNRRALYLLDLIRHDLPFAAHPRLSIRLDDPETRALWYTALAAKAEVESWPAWKHTEPGRHDLDSDDFSERGALDGMARRSRYDIARMRAKKDDR